MKRVLVLVEGQTEERFVKDVLEEPLAANGVFLFPMLLTTKRVKSGPNFKGGVTSYGKVKNDLNRLLNDSDAQVTTLIDYYGLPADCPGMTSRPNGGSPIERVTHVQNAISDDLNSASNLKVYLALHEFEALLFSNCAETAAAIPASERSAEMEKIAGGLEPEEINEEPDTAPSKRIMKVFPEFRKTLHGPTAAKRIGLPTLREKCPHFHSWVTWLENLAATDLN